MLFLLVAFALAGSVPVLIVIRGETPIVFNGR
jgi:hypothetical protein